MSILHWPIKERSINQHFGENKACVDLATGKKVIICNGNNPPPGWRSVYGEDGHRGIDLRAGRGTEVYCAQRGRVYHIDTQERTGLDVRIESDIAGHGRFRHIYEHLQGVQVQLGDIVETGQLIGWADNTGFSSNDHLHFEVHKLGNDWVPINPVLVLSNLYARDVLRINNKLRYAAEMVALLLDNVADYLRRNKS